jgi:hypothetical protein
MKKIKKQGETLPDIDFTHAIDRMREWMGVSNYMLDVELPSEEEE